jgi:hypothetical protein
MDGAPSLGACVQCRPAHNEDCAYTVKGSKLYIGAYASNNGAHCQNDSCVEGCDTDADCPTSRTCHLGKPGDALNHKCVECACDANSLSPDGTYCEMNGAGRACEPTAAGNPRVCDKNTLLCRKKRQNEFCTPGQHECGDVNDPTVPSTCTTLSVCVEQITGVLKPYCSADHASGRCGIPCYDLQYNECSAGANCPGSLCQQATADTGPGKYCVSLNCNYP